MSDDEEPIFNPDTGEVQSPGEDECPYCAKALNERMHAEYELRAVERDLRKIRAERDRLRTELAGQKQKAESYGVAHALGRYWILRCGKDQKRTKLGDKRLDKVKARLKDYDPYYIARAIDGLADYHFVGENGKHHDDLELVCRDETKTENYWELATENGVRTMVTRDWLREFGLDVTHDIHELLEEIDEQHTRKEHRLMPQYDDEMKGVLFKHDKQGNDRAPDYKGRCQIDGKELSLSAWIRTSNNTGQKFMSLAFDAPQGQGGGGGQQPNGGGQQQQIQDDDIPF